jgi:hypothetical protein
LKKLLLAAAAFAVFTLNGVDAVQLVAAIAFLAGVFCARFQTVASLPAPPKSQPACLVVWVTTGSVAVRLVHLRLQHRSPSPLNSYCDSDPASNPIRLKR